MRSGRRVSLPTFVANWEPERDRMKSWIKGDYMAYKPGAAVPQLTNALTFSGSELFKRTFEEGMAMVEETATYLDGKGRAESKLLPSKAALAYAGESMRLTTRDRKSTRLNSSHLGISYAVFCLKK